MSRELYEQAVKQARDNGHWALHNALVEDGYDEKVDYSKLLDGPISERP